MFTKSERTAKRTKRPSSSPLRGTSVLEKAAGGLGLLLLMLPALSQQPKTKKKPTPAVLVVTVTARTLSTVPGNVFTLGEIADFTGKDKTLIEQLKTVEVGTSPLPGLSRDLSPGDITVKLRATHLEGPRVTLSAPPLMHIQRAHINLEGNALVKAAVEAAQPALTELPDARLEAENPPDSLKLPKGKMQLLAGAVIGRAENGILRVPIDIVVDGRRTQTVEIMLRVRRTLRVLVANRQLEPNDILTLDDVTLAKIDLPSGFVRPLSTAKSALGKRVKKRILADAPISAVDLEIPLTISANADVTILYISGPIQVTARVRALQSGSVGDTIRVFSLETHKEVQAVVINSHTVRMVDDAEETPSETPNETEQP